MLSPGISGGFPAGVPLGTLGQYVGNQGVGFGPSGGGGPTGGLGQGGGTGLGLSFGGAPFSGSFSGDPLSLISSILNMGGVGPFGASAPGAGTIDPTTSFLLQKFGVNPSSLIGGNTNLSIDNLIASLMGSKSFGQIPPTPSMTGFGQIPPMPQVQGNWGMDLSKFDPSLHALNQVESLGAGGPYAGPDLGPLSQTTQGMNEALAGPQVAGGGTILDPQAMQTGAALGQPARAQATAQQAANYVNQQMALSNILQQAQQGKGDISQMAQQLTTMNQDAVNRALQNQFGLTEEGQQLLESQFGLARMGQGLTAAEQGYVRDLMGLTGQAQTQAESRIGLIDAQARLRQQQQQASLLNQLAGGGVFGGAGGLIGNLLKGVSLQNLLPGGGGGGGFNFSPFGGGPSGPDLSSLIFNQFLPGSSPGGP